MIAEQENHFAKIVVIGLGCLLLLMGIITFIYPQIMTRYGLITDNVHARLTIRALIGGSEIGFGLYMLLGQKAGASISARLWTGLSIFIGIVAARFASLIISNGPISNMIYRELVAESLIVMLISLALFLRSRR